LFCEFKIWIIPYEQIELVELYLDLISTISEEEISILYYHRFFDDKFENIIDELYRLKDKLNSIKENQKRGTIIFERSKYADEEIETIEGIEKIENWLEPLRKFRTAKYYNLDDNKFTFLKQRLFSKGLLVDNLRNRIDSGAFQNMGITEFGIEFIKGNE